MLWLGTGISIMSQKRDLSENQAITRWDKANSSITNSQFTRTPQNVQFTCSSHIWKQ